MKDKQGEKLISAILQDDIETIIFLLEEIADINYHDSKGWTPLHYTAQRGDIKIAGLLLEKGADVNASDNFGNNVLWRATFASQGKGDFVRFLLQNGADMNAKNISNISPLELAKTISNFNVIQFFV